MKTAIASGVLILCLIMLITANSIYCIGITEDLKDMVSADKIFTVNDTEKLEEYWNKHKMIMHLGVNSSYTDNISEGIAEFKAAVKTNSEADIAASLNLLNFRINELEELNRLSFVNIF